MQIAFTTIYSLPDPLRGGLRGIVAPGARGYQISHEMIRPVLVTVQSPGERARRVRSGEKRNKTGFGSAIGRKEKENRKKQKIQHFYWIFKSSNAAFHF